MTETNKRRDLDVHFVNPSSVFLLDKGRHLGACSRNVTAYFPPTR